MSEGRKISLVTIIVTVAVSIPTWLPVFGIEAEWLGSNIARLFSRLMPFVTAAIGFAGGVLFVLRSKTERFETELKTKDSEISKIKEQKAQIEALYTHLRGCDLKCQAYEELICKMLEKTGAADRAIHGERFDEIRHCNDLSKLRRMT